MTTVLMERRETKPVLKKGYKPKKPIVVTLSPKKSRELYSGIAKSTRKAVGETHENSLQIAHIGNLRVTQ